MKIRGLRLNLTPQQQRYLLIGGGVAAAGVAAAVLIPKVMGVQVGSVSLQTATGGDDRSGIAPFEVHFYGEVLDVDSKPIPNFRVNLFVNDASVAHADTDKSGAFVFDPVFTEEGTYACYAAPSASSSVKSAVITISVQGASAGAVLSRITISASSLEITTAQTTTISGKALDQNGSGVTGKALYLFANETTKVAQTTTGSDGGYSFDASFPGAGLYSLDVSDSTQNT